MKKVFVFGLAVLMVLGLATMAMGAEYTVDLSFVSGHLHTGYSNATYTDMVEIFSADANFSATYNATDLTRNWNMHDSLFWPGGPSSYGPAQPGPVDFIDATATENATGYFVTQYQEYQKAVATEPGKPVYGDGNICGDATVDFSADTAEINNKGWAGGHWFMLQEVGKDADANPSIFPAGDYLNRVTGGPVEDNDINWLHTTATFGGETMFYGSHPSLPPGCQGIIDRATPANIGLVLLNPTGMDVDGQLGGSWSYTTMSYSDGIPIKSDSVVNPGGMPLYGFLGDYSGDWDQLFEISIYN